VAATKTYAKLASAMQKPDGLTLLVDPERILSMTDELALSKVWGIGARRMARLSAAGIKTIGEARKVGAGPFMKLFGSYFGRLLWEVVTGKDVGGVVEELVHRPQEVSYLHTFPAPSQNPDAIMNELLKAVAKVAYRMRGYRAYASHYVGYLRFQDASWNGVQFRFSSGQLTNLDDLILRGMSRKAQLLTNKVLGQGHKLRGVGLTTLGLTYNKQGNLFARDTELMGHLYVAIDRLNNRFGFDTIYKASQRLDVHGQTHFVERS
jgi:DNA polymerase-4